MKNHKLPTFPLWISLGVLIGILFPRFMPHIDSHSGFYQFLTNLFLVGVTASYVWLTHRMLETQRLDLKMKRKYIIVPDIKIVSDEFEYDFNEIQNYSFEKWIENNLKLIVKNVSKYSASELKLYLLAFIRNKEEQEIRYFVERNPAIMSGETIEEDISILIPEVFHQTSEKETMEMLKIPVKIQNYFLEQIEKRKKAKPSDFRNKMSGSDIALLYFAVQYETAYDTTEIVARDFLVFCYPVGKDKTKVVIRPSPREMLREEREVI